MEAIIANPPHVLLEYAAPVKWACLSSTCLNATMRNPSRRLARSLAPYSIRQGPELLASRWVAVKELEYPETMLLLYIHNMVILDEVLQHQPSSRLPSHLVCGGCKSWRDPGA